MQNFDLQKEIADQSEQDWIFGGLSQPGIVSIPLNERAAYLPQGELQYDTIGIDFNDCATRSPTNHFEALLTYHFTHAMQPENKQWLQDKGYIQEGKVVFSDRYVAVGSNTTRQGNSLKAPLDFIYKNGLIPKSLLPKGDTMTWEDYMNPAAITQEMRDLGKAFLARFTLNYERIHQEHIAEALKDDMIGVALHAWDAPINGVYQKTDEAFNHAVLLYNLPAYQAFDNYYDQNVVGDFTKTLAPDYTFYEWGYRAYLSAETTPAETQQGNALFAWLARMIAWITGGQKVVMPPIPAEILPVKKNS